MFEPRLRKNFTPPVTIIFTSSPITNITGQAIHLTSPDYHSNPPAHTDSKTHDMYLYSERRS